MDKLIAFGGGVTAVGPKNHVLDRVKIGRIHSQPRAVTSRRCGLLPNYFRDLFRRGYG